MVLALRCYARRLGRAVDVEGLHAPGLDNPLPRLPREGFGGAHDALGRDPEVSGQGALGQHSSGLGVRGQDVRLEVVQSFEDAIKRIARIKPQGWDPGPLGRPGQLG